jgi:YHS domain-containing protein
MRRRHFRCDSCLRFDRYTTKGFPGWRAESTACRSGTHPIPGIILDSETAAMLRPTRPRFAIPRLVVPACLAALVAACTATAATAGVTWHPDLAAARAASATTQKPVLAVFTAGWSPESTRFAEHTLTSPEATALISACFEPVRIDVDAQPEITKRLRVAHVPSACVVAANDEPLAAFDCPEPPPEFVAAAARAAQDAAVLAAATAAPLKVERVAHAVVPPARTPADLTAVGFAVTPPAGDAAVLPGSDVAAPGKGSISLVTAKVRQLATFASGSLPAAAAAVAGTPAGPAAPTMPIAAHLDPTSNVNRLVVATSAEPPALPRTPPTWPAEAPATAPAFTTAAMPQKPVRESIEPVQSASATTPAPAAATAGSWLSQPVGPQQPAAPALPAPQAAPATASTTLPPTEPDSSASVSDLPEKAPKPSAWSSFVAAMQKPFTVFTKPAAKPATTPTLPPAWPTSPLAPQVQPGSAVAQQTPAPAAATPSPAPTMPTPAPTTPAPAPSATAQAAPPAVDGPDTYGSMPLGLEGYCPVTLADRGVWTEGRAQWGARHRGRTYLFAGPEQQQAFLANPDRYAPALSGDDPVLAFDQGRTAPGRRAYGVTYQSRMYLFSSPETKAAFTANPDRYTTNVVLAERPTPSAATRRY